MYRDINGLYWRVNVLAQYLQQAEELDCSGIDDVIKSVEAQVEKGWKDFQALEPNAAMRALEPDDYEGILSLCPQGGGKNYFSALPENYAELLKASMLSRFSGCTLGAIVEGWKACDIESYAKKLGLEYPLTDYWTDTPSPDLMRYNESACRDYLRDRLDSVPNDDDIAFVILALLIAEEGGGFDFTVEDVARVWLKYVTVAYTAEEAALRNLRNNIPAKEAAVVDNPFMEWIGADIRCDGFAYMAPGCPRLAAKLAYTDSYLTHRRNGIYGSMFFAATISAAFALGDPFKALEAGLLEIPEKCRLAEDIRWALEKRFEIKDFHDAIDAVDGRYPGMSITHTLNNACLTVFALHLGGKDIGKCFSNAVAMAHDNDCTAATVGSIAGACYGMDALDERWYKRFNDRVKCFYNGPKEYKISDLLSRYMKLAGESIEVRKGMSK